MNSISTEQEMEFKQLLDLLAELVAKRLDQKPITVNSDLIEGIVEEVVSHGGFQLDVEEQTVNAVRGLTFSVEVD